MINVISFETFEEEEIIDIEAVHNEIAGIKVLIEEVVAQMEKYMEGLGL